MRIDERVSFLIASKQFSPAQISELLGLVPDRAVDMAERPQSHVHLWCLTGRQNESAAYSTLSEDIRALIERLRPHTQRIASIDRSETNCSLTLSRRFYTDEREASVGWAIAAEDVQFLCDAGLDLDVDEYDFALYGQDDVDENGGHSSTSNARDSLPIEGAIATIRKYDPSTSQFFR
jgi:hypothetical protein